MENLLDYHQDHSIQHDDNQKLLDEKEHLPLGLKESQWELKPETAASSKLPSVRKHIVDQ